jgi:hypothetical protein
MHLETQNAVIPYMSHPSRWKRVRKRTVVVVVVVHVEIYKMKEPSICS